MRREGIRSRLNRTIGAAAALAKPGRMLTWLMVLALAGESGANLARGGPVEAADDSLMSRFNLPAAWRDQFWSSAGAKILLRLDPKQLAELVPVQSGLRFCRCPACNADEGDEPLVWSIEQPKVLKCRRCGLVVPSDQFPARIKNELPEEIVEVSPRVWHRYPYHQVEEPRARYPDERLYLHARRDYEARKYLARAALYAAAEYRAKVPAERDPRLATLACVIILRFAQVYPAYACHLDQPDRPKLLQPARLQPPFRRGYQTGKWEWNGSQEIPVNLVMARGLLRGDAAWGRAGALLGEPAPESTVDRDLFRASVEFARLQPEDFTEESLHLYRGILTVGRLMGDNALVEDAMGRLDAFTRRGFYHDGLWRDAEPRAHRRVMVQVNGWLMGLLPGEPSPSAAHQGGAGPGPSAFPILALARQVDSALGATSSDDEVVRASWPGRPVPDLNRRPLMLGGAGLARLAIGRGDDALDVELRGLDGHSGPHFQRLSLRLCVGGRPMLDDLDDQAPTTRGWELATASHNTVVVNGLNQRETPRAAALPAPGSDFLFFAADPDFQVVTADDPRAYPQSTTRFRHTLIATAGRKARYVLSVFEIRGGLQHDQIYHAAPGRNERWSIGAALAPPPVSLLPATISFLPSALAKDGRWFVQSYGEFQPLGQAVLARPSVAALLPAVPRGPVEQGSGGEPGPPRDMETGLRLHLLGDTPIHAVTAVSPDPTPPVNQAHENVPPGRASLVLRHGSERGGPLSSVFVTLLEPTGPGFPALLKVGRVASEPDLVVVLVETEEGTEHLIVNLKPGTSRRVALASGRFISFDGLATRLREQSVVLAGGTFVEAFGKLVSQPSLTGTISQSVRKSSDRGLGWFLTPARLGDAPVVAGRTLVVMHGDGSCRSWTVDSIESTAEGTRLHVREEPGFTLDPTGAARYYQFPQATAPGPHHFRIALMAR